MSPRPIALLMALALIGAGEEECAVQAPADLPPPRRCRPLPSPACRLLALHSSRPAAALPPPFFPSRCRQGAQSFLWAHRVASASPLPSPPCPVLPLPCPAPVLACSRRRQDAHLRPAGKHRLPRGAAGRLCCRRPRCRRERTERHLLLLPCESVSEVGRACREAGGQAGGPAGRHRVAHKKHQYVAGGGATSRGWAVLDHRQAGASCSSVLWLSPVECGVPIVPSTLETANWASREPWNSGEAGKQATIRGTRF